MITSLVFIVVVVTTMILLIRILYSTIKKNRKRAFNNSSLLLVILGIYFLILVAVSLATPRRVIQPGEVWRFDHWGIAVEKVERIGGDSLYDRIAITFNVSNDARRANQKARDIIVMMVDEDWNKYPISLTGQRTFESTGNRQKGFDTEMPPQTSFTTVRIFDIPRTGQEWRIIVEHGVWPGRLIIGSESSLFQKQAYMRLDKPGSQSPK